ncbi:ATP adenylyltransferase family protein [Lyngbya confervoides]|uniref:Phosphorylase n=1 Tax=Lyngbya confervoides BDU141951 TaxID=1574623 RepID=A0ABD4T6H4_9CYAN|nr:phosphorylase [Lyngbya confervoides]MCM1984241.1 phosphorylase [Lyngbya confervoides BDU141951]
MPFSSPPGSLWPKLRARSQQALASEALQPISTYPEWVEQDGFTFLVRVVENLQRKDQVQKKRLAHDPTFNPFLPYEPAMFVADISPTHLVLLNKFKVMDHHFLIVTREFVAQETWLTAQDFAALAWALAEVDGLGFYNSDAIAGASQRHKHLQVVPKPLAPGGPSIPLEPVIAAAIAAHESQAQLPFSHGLSGLPPPAVGTDADQNQDVLSLDAFSQELYARYGQLMQRLNLGHPETDDRSLGSYNLLVTRQWMMVVPRSQEGYTGLSINALGFAGALLVRNRDQLQQLQQQRIAHILATVTTGNLP